MEDICQSRCQQKGAYAKRIPGLPPVIGRHTNVPDEESELGAVEPEVLCCVHKLQESRDTEPTDALNISKPRTPWSPAKLRPAYASRKTAWGCTVHLTHDALRRVTYVPRPPPRRHTMLYKAPIPRRRVRPWRRRGIVQPLAHDDELRQRARGRHRRLCESGGRGVGVHG